MNHDLPSLRQRLYELLEVLRPDFEQREEGTQEGDREEARKELAELLEKYPSLIDGDLLETWHDLARADDLLGDAIQDVAVPEPLKQQILAAVRSRMS